MKTLLLLKNKYEKQNFENQVSLFWGMWSGKKKQELTVWQIYANLVIKIHY